MMSYDYPHPVSRTYQYKKITKPLLERKRRARINRCLDELKDLMVDALETEGENISKLEKADILELTVRHLQRLHASRPSGLSSSASPNEDASSNESRWQSGFGHCAAEACRYLAALPGESGERLARHLASGLQSTQQISAASPLSPKLELPSPSIISSPERISANFSESLSPHLPMDISSSTVDFRDSESPIDSSRYSVLSESSTIHEIPKTPTNSSAQISDRHVDRDSYKNNKTRSPPVVFRKESKEQLSNIAVKMAENKIVCKIDSRVVSGNDDEEEIDVEGVDENDPMWRPW